jgi:hypothetical protein
MLHDQAIIKAKDIRNRIGGGTGCWGKTSVEEHKVTVRGRPKYFPTWVWNILD